MAILPQSRAKMIKPTFSASISGRDHKQAASWLIDMLGLFVFLVCFYSLWLNTYPLFSPDEARYSEVAREMLISHDYVTPRVNGVIFLDKPILYYWLQAAAIHLFGLHEWSLRFFPLLFAILGCLFTYACGRHLFDRRTGLLAALMLASAPLYFGNAHYADLNLEVSVWISSSLLAFITALYTPRWRNIFLFCAYFFAGCAFLTKGLIGIVFPIMIIGVWLVSLHKWRLLAEIHLLKGILLIALINLPWYLLVQQHNPEFFHYFFITQQFSRFVSAGKFNNEVPIWFYLPVVMAGFYPWIVVLIPAITKVFTTSRHHIETHAKLWYLFLCVILIFIFFSIPHAKTVGYILPIFPAIALLIANYLADQWKTARLRQWRFAQWSFILLSVVIALLLLSLPYTSWLPINNALSHHLVMIAAILLVSALVAAFMTSQKKWGPLFILFLLSNSAILATVVHSAQHYQSNSIKPLIAQLQQYLTPHDAVMSYFKYFYDAPIYLQQKVMVVDNWNKSDILQRDNWRREWLLGIETGNTSAQLISENALLHRWHNQQRIYIFVSRNYLEQFQQLVKKYYVIDEYNHVLLICNHPTNTH